MVRNLHFFQAGTSQSRECLALRGGDKRKSLFPAIVAVFEHPSEGVILFDTGFAPRFYEATRSFPEKLYPLVIPVRISPEETALARLKKSGIQAGDVRFVICSHFHADHIAGAADFTRARYIYSQEGYESLRVRTRWDRFRAGFLSRLLPWDFEQRGLALSHNQFQSRISDLHDFHTGFDLFGDGSVVLLELPGHATGQLGAIIRESSGKNYFLASDACWTEASYRRYLPPPKLVMNLLFDNKKQYETTLRRIYEFAKAYPDFQIVPGHCPDTLRMLSSKVL